MPRLSCLVSAAACGGVLLCGAPRIHAAQRGTASAPTKTAARNKRGAPQPVAKSAPPKSPPLVSLEVLPREFSLNGPAAQQLLVVTGKYADGTVRDVSQQVRYVSANPRVAAVGPDGLVRSAADGDAAVKAILGKVAAQTTAKVAGSHAPAQVSFMRDVVPTLTQAGCNSLSCHGSPVGKAGFKLSMFGYEPSQDYDALVKQERTGQEKGKRADPADPEKSLFLLKATLQVPHQGGLRFKKDSPQYARLLAWLREGARPDSGDVAPAVTQLDVLPAERVFSAPGDRQRLVVMAHYSDGAVEDVTHKSIFVSNDDAVVQPTEGAAQATGVGETVMMARYLGHVGLSQFLLAQAVPVAPGDYAAFKSTGYVDDLALAKWKKMRVAPSASSTDQEFLRRVSLDLTGTLPKPDEIRAFVADPASDKRLKKIDELLARPEYADWWTVFWGDALRNNGKVVQPGGAKAYHDWIRQSLVDNKPYDQFVRELLTASGGTFTAGAANFYRVAPTPPERAEQVAQLFLGIRLQCAQCHNHPFEKWTRNNYHQFAAFFARVQSQGKGNAESQISSQPKGEYKHPETGQIMAPAVLADQQVDVPVDKDRREVLAAWVTSPENTLFARNLVNRLWAQLFGRGIVEPVDDVRVTNPPVNEPLLDALAKDFVAHHFDVKYMLRTLAGSRTYQASAAANRFNAKDTQNFSRAYFRRLKAEALLDGVCQATGIPEAYGKDNPAGTRAIQLVDNRVNSYFLDIFGRPRREVVCSCEREETANLTQALQLINGPVNQKIGDDKGRVNELIRAGKTDREIVEELYLCTVSRAPTPAETDRALKQIEAAPKNRRQTLEDLFWVLLNSREFLFNH